MGHSEWNLGESMTSAGKLPKFLCELESGDFRAFLMAGPFVLFQTLCILANIADGTTAKELIMTNDDILQKIKYYMVGLYPFHGPTLAAH